MSINISGVMFKSPIENEIKFLEKYFHLQNIDGREQSTWEEIQFSGVRPTKEKTRCMAIYQKGGASIIYFSIDYFNHENIADLWCKDLLKTHDGVCFTCSETAMAYTFIFYTNGKRERMTITYPPTGSRKISGKNNLKLPRNGDPIFDGLAVLQNEYVGGYEEKDSVNLYWISKKQAEKNLNKSLRSRNHNAKTITNNNQKKDLGDYMFTIILTAIVILLIILFSQLL